MSIGVSLAYKTTEGSLELGKNPLSTVHSVFSSLQEITTNIELNIKGSFLNIINFNYHSTDAKVQKNQFIYVKILLKIFC